MRIFSRFFTGRSRQMTRAAMIPLLLLLGGCAMLNSSHTAKKESESGSLYHTYTLVDEQGRKSGTLVTKPLGKMELRDADGNLVGVLVPEDTGPQVQQVPVGKD